MLNFFNYTRFYFCFFIFCFNNCYSEVESYTDIPSVYFDFGLLDLKIKNVKFDLWFSTNISTDLEKIFIIDDVAWKKVLYQSSFSIFFNLLTFQDENMAYCLKWYVVKYSFLDFNLKKISIGVKLSFICFFEFYFAYDFIKGMFIGYGVSPSFSKKILLGMKWNFDKTQNNFYKKIGLNSISTSTLKDLSLVCPKSDELSYIKYRDFQSLFIISYLSDKFVCCKIDSSMIVSYKEECKNIITNGSFYGKFRESAFDYILNGLIKVNDKKNNQVEYFIANCRFKPVWGVTKEIEDFFNKNLDFYGHFDKKLYIEIIEQMEFEEKLLSIEQKIKWFDISVKNISKKSINTIHYAKIYEALIYFEFLNRYYYKDNSFRFRGDTFFYLSRLAKKERILYQKNNLEFSINNWNKIKEKFDILIKNKKHLLNIEKDLDNREELLIEIERLEKIKCDFQNISNKIIEAEKLLLSYLENRKLAIKLNEIIIDVDDDLKKEYSKALKFFGIDDDEFKIDYGEFAIIEDRKGFFENKYNDKKTCIRKELAEFNEFYRGRMNELKEKFNVETLIEEEKEELSCLMDNFYKLESDSEELDEYKELLMNFL